MLQTIDFTYNDSLLAEGADYNAFLHILRLYSPCTLNNPKRVQALWFDLQTIHKGTCGLDGKTTEDLRKYRTKFDSLSRLLNAYQNQDGVSKANCIIHIGNENITIHLDELGMVDRFVKSIISLLCDCNIQIGDVSELSAEECLTQSIAFCNQVINDNNNVWQPRLQAMFVVLEYYRELHWMTFPNTNQYMHFLYEVADLFGMIQSPTIAENESLFQGSNDSLIWNNQRGYIKPYINKNRDYTIILSNPLCRRKSIQPREACNSKIEK